LVLDYLTGHGPSFLVEESDDHDRIDVVPQDDPPRSIVIANLQPIAARTDGWHRLLISLLSHTSGLSDRVDPGL
jgi:hypothetical protein